MEISSLAGKPAPSKILVNIPNLITGLIDVIIHPQLYELSRYLFGQSPILIVEGIIEQKGAVLNIKATHLVSA